VLKSGVFSVVSKPVEEFPARSQDFGHVTKRDNVFIQGFQGEAYNIPVSDARKVMSLAAEYQHQGPSVQGTQDYASYTFNKLTHEALSKDDIHLPVLEGLDSHVSLNGCMQSTVPKPLNSKSSMSGYQSYLNMPGGGEKLLDKYISGKSQFCHQSRHFTTSSRQFVSQQGAQDTTFREDELLPDPTPQGIQGDNCVQFRLWMENCQRYNLPNCDEQLESINTGRKTLAQVFQEQQEIIRLVAESYKNDQRKMVKQMDSEINAQGQQDYFGYSYEFSTVDPCPQGLQGEDCANYKAWAHNCQAFGFGDCNGKAHDIRTGRRTLQDVFDEQDQMIRKIVANFQQKRSYSTNQKPEVGKESSGTQSEPNNNQNSSSPHSTLPHDLQKLSKKDQLKQAVKQYGGTVIVFHIGISLISLGGFYLAVSR
jgi:hypothetical protein